MTRNFIIFLVLAAALLGTAVIAWDRNPPFQQGVTK